MKEKSHSTLSPDAFSGPRSTRGTAKEAITELSRWKTLVKVRANERIRRSLRNDEARAEKNEDRRKEKRRRGGTRKSRRERAHNDARGEEGRGGGGGGGKKGRSSPLEDSVPGRRVIGSLFSF